jgi:hypothetical protein
MIFGATTRREHRSRRVLALILFAWLSLLVQPCVAGLPAVPAAAEHCDHGSTPDHDMACHAVQAADCEMAADLNVGSPPAADWPRAAELIAVLPLAEGSLTASGRAQLRATTTGPPLTIRFCNLRN